VKSVDDSRQTIPMWYRLRYTVITSACENRTFMNLVVRVYDDARKALSAAVEYFENDPAILELEMGGGMTWVEYFTDWDRVMVIDMVIFGTAESRLEDPRPYYKAIEATLGPLGNRGAWEMYRQWVDEAFVEIKELEWYYTKAGAKRKKNEIWDDYTRHFERRFPGKKAC
ncbi:MAG: hypothetical protein WCO71_10885, partial [Pseudomonadota bacterium]